MSKNITRIGIGGPVGSGKTAIVEAITPRFLDLGIKVLIITNDVVTTEDAKHVQRTLKGILLQERFSEWRQVPALIPRCAKTKHEPCCGRGYGTALSGYRRRADRKWGDNLTLTFRRRWWTTSFM
jgi:hypothetical protein